MSKITSDTLLVGIDISDGNDESVLTVARVLGNRVIDVKVIRGETAEQIYHDLVYREEVFEEVGKAADDGIKDGIKTVEETMESDTPKKDLRLITERILLSAEKYSKKKT